MITIFNRKKLAVDSSQEGLGRIKLALKAAGIEYRYVTVKNSPYMESYRNVAATMQYNLPYRDHISFTYRIYVRRRDYGRAREVCFGS